MEGKTSTVAAAEDGGCTNAALRKEPAYWFTFASNAKMRWYERRILDVLVDEFREREKQYYVWAIRTGLLLINGKPVKPDYIVKNGDKMNHTTHKHEPPISSDPVRILYRNDQEGRLVIVKPGSVPVHPAGRYLRHTLLELLKSDYGIEKVWTANRLDRLTSGIMVCSTNVVAAKALSADFESGRVRKAYVCRAKGCFPETEMTCQAPLLTLDRQSGLVITHATGRQAKTIFNRLSYDAATDTSVIFCRPITGRTHQIRVHLQLLGYPIPNDPIYNHPIFEQYPPAGFADLVVPAEHMPQAAEPGVHPAQVSLFNHHSPSTKYLLTTPLASAVVEALKDTKDQSEDFSRLKGEVRFAEWNRQQGWAEDAESARGANAGPAKGDEAVLGDDKFGYCPECYLPLLPDPPLDSLFIYLHAIRYETDEWSFEDEMPWWARDGWTNRDAMSRAREARERGEVIRPPRLQLMTEEEGMKSNDTSQEQQQLPVGPRVLAEDGNNSIASNGTSVPSSLQSIDASASRAKDQPSDPSHRANGSSSSFQHLFSLPIQPSSTQQAMPLPLQVVPLALEVFRGLEDVAVRDLSLRLEAPRALTALHSSQLLLPVSSSRDALQARLPFVSGKRLVLGSMRLPDDLLNDLLVDRSRLGTSKQANRKSRESKGKSKRAVDAAQLAARELQAQAVERTAKGKIASEARLASLIEDLWHSSASSIADGLTCWQSLARPDQPNWTFRATVDRSTYKFPTMNTTDVERLLGDLVWNTLNGPDDGTAASDVLHPVNLSKADLDVQLLFSPWLDGTETPRNLMDSEMIRDGVNKGDSILQGWEYNPPGSLLLTIKLDDKDASAVFPHRPQIDFELTEGGTSLARFRAYSLAALLPLPIKNPLQPVKIWEPCCGSGAVVIELANTLQERGIAGHVYGSDIEGEDVEHGKIIAKSSGWPVDTASKGDVSIHLGQVDLRDEAGVSAFLGNATGDALDGIVTDLPWGQRVLSHGALRPLYAHFLRTCLVMLKPNCYACLLTLSVKTLQRALSDVDVAARRGGQAWTMQLEQLDVPDGSEASIVEIQGQRQAKEASGVRIVEMGLRPCVCLLRKVAIV